MNPIFLEKLGTQLGVAFITVPVTALAFAWWGWKGAAGVSVGYLVNAAVLLYRASRS